MATGGGAEIHIEVAELDDVVDECSGGGSSVAVCALAGRRGAVEGGHGWPASGCAWYVSRTSQCGDRVGVAHLCAHAAGGWAGGDDRDRAAGAAIHGRRRA